jgi:hypothetical protein
MNLNELIEQVNAACAKPGLTIHAGDAVGDDSECQLRWRHLDHVDDMAGRNTPRAETMRVYLRHYEHFFGRLRKRRRDEVPSDQLRKFFIVSNILDQVDARRAEIEEEAAYRDSR